MISNSIKIKGVLFDMDGTVLDSEHLFEKAQIKLLKKFQIDVSRLELLEFKGMSYKDFYPRFISKFNLNQDIDYLRNMLRNFLHKTMETELKFIDGFENFFKTRIINKGFKVGLVTNTTRLSYSKIQTCINIDDYFDYVLTVNEVPKPKPSPAPYLHAMQNLKLNYFETIILEDSKMGLISANNSNATVIGLTTSLNYNEIKEIDKNINVCKSYNEVDEYFQNI